MTELPPPNTITVAIGAAVMTSISTLIFGLSMYFPQYGGEMVSYASCIFLAIAFVTTTVANEQLTSNVLAARMATALAIVYCTIVCMVYFIQLSFLRLAPDLGPETMTILSYQHAGSAAFAVDILAYTFLSLSMVCLGLSLETSSVLRKWWIGFGVWGCTGIAAPLMPFFYAASKDDSDATGTLVLSVWAMGFFPAMVVLARHYQRLGGGGGGGGGEQQRSGTQKAD